MPSISENVRIVKDRIAEAAVRSNRDPSKVRLMAVTKTVDDEAIMKAIEAGIKLIGENYIQEAKRKIEKMGHDVEWHMIGHLQSKKSKYAVNLFDMVHSVDRISLARELDKRAAMAGRVMDVLIEVNVSREETKSGVPADAVMELVRETALLKNLFIKGLMTMPPWFEDPEDARPYFVALKEVRDRVKAADIPGVEMQELSMGMSGDYEVAVEEGATIVRVGTAIFGPRRY